MFTKRPTTIGRYNLCPDVVVAEFKNREKIRDSSIILCKWMYSCTSITDKEYIIAEVYVLEIANQTKVKVVG